MEVLLISPGKIKFYWFFNLWQTVPNVDLKMKTNIFKLIEPFFQSKIRKFNQISLSF